MKRKLEPSWVLGFDSATVVETWADARIADAIETLWRDAGGPASAQACWMACADQYAFRWYVSEALARMLDDANVSWREFVIGKADGVPASARPYLERRVAASQPDAAAHVRSVRRATLSR